MVDLRADLSRYKLDDRLATLKDCRRCPRLNPSVNEAAIQVVPGAGNLNAPALLLFEQPGETEAVYGFPVIGPSHIFMEWLEQKFKFDPLNDFFITNSVMCRSSDGKVTVAELNNCRTNLDTIIREMKNLKLIVTVGGTALRQIEGESSVLSLRQGCVGRLADYRFRDGKTLGRPLFTVAFKHPAWLMHIKNEHGREAATRAYISQLAFLRDVYHNIDRIETSFPYRYTYCLEEEQCFEELNKMLTDPYIENIVWDFETGGINRGWGHAVCLAASYDDYQAVVFPLRQFVDSSISENDLFYDGHGDSYYLRPFFSGDFLRRFVEMGRPLWEPVAQPTSRPRPFPSGWNVWFETRVFRHSLGVELVPRPEQMNDLHVLNALSRKFHLPGELPVEPHDGRTIFSVPPFDIMTAFRLVTNELRSLSLRNVLSWMMPMEADAKDPIELELGSGGERISQYGFAQMAVKYDRGMRGLLDELYHKHASGVSLTRQQKRLLEKFYAMKAGKPKLDVLLERAAFDADSERRLISRLLSMLSDGELIFSGLPSVQASPLGK